MTVCLCPHRQMGDGLIQALHVLWVLNRDGKVNIGELVQPVQPVHALHLEGEKSLRWLFGVGRKGQGEQVRLPSFWV
jgi:hypothetical protein